MVTFLRLVLLAVLVPFAATAQDAPLRIAVGDLGEGPVYRVPIDGMIDNALARYVDRAVADAIEADAALILFEVDTFGGLVDAADAIRTAILDVPMPTIAFINKNAASAGALISYAADTIVMAPGGSMGAATAVDMTGEYASEKVQSYMRSLMRATAEANGRDPRIAEAMVDETLAVPGVVEAGQLLSLSANEALDLGVAEALASSSDELLADLGVAERTQVAHAASSVERVLRFLGSPVLASILMLMMMGGLYFELQTPGVGFPGLMAVVGAALFFAPHYMLGLVQSWEILLFAIGIILLMVEVFVTPGFGVAGITGVLLVVGSLLAALIPNVGLDFPTGAQLARASITLATTFVLLIVLAASLSRYLPRSERFSRLILVPELASAEGYTSADTDTTLMGQTGTTVTALRPSGTAAISDRRVDVIAQGTFIPAGTPIEVVGVSGSRVEVRPVA
ncbi:MAG: nodulation protein NfeD [Rhodothermaceae bacterium]|nr:nodulation protein NfeD [Rhodothermaceae bacterium]